MGACVRVHVSVGDGFESPSQFELAVELWQQGSGREGWQVGWPAAEGKEERGGEEEMEGGLNPNSNLNSPCCGCWCVFE